MADKTVVERKEWYSWAREYPEQYKIIKQYIRDHTTYRPIRYQGLCLVDLIIPRRWFTDTSMLTFLSRYRHVAEFAHIDFRDEVDYKGDTYITIGIEYEALPRSLMCDYLWYEVKRVLAKLERNDT